MPLLEIACDESGYEGDKLVGGTTDVFAHASVRMSVESAAAYLTETRRRIRSPATEYKANHLLRQKHRRVLMWLLGPAGPLRDSAHVFLVHKAFLVLGTIVELLVNDATGEPRLGLRQDEPTKAMTTILYNDGRGMFGPTEWAAFLTCSNDLLRVKDVGDNVGSFFRMVDVLRRGGAHGHVAEVLERLGQARPRAESLRARLVADPTMIKAMDPLIPAIFEAATYWAVGTEPVHIVHDQTKALDEHLKQHAFASLRVVDSRSDPRVQIADFLAGVARRIATDALGGRGDPELIALLRPYVDSSSVWGDSRSWELLGPPAEARA